MTYYLTVSTGHSALGQPSALGHPSGFSQPSALGQQGLSFWQHFSTHSVFAQHLVAHFLPSSLQQQATVQSAIAAINNIFFITLKFNMVYTSDLIKSSKSEAKLH